jgi:hypothetical protein
MTILARHENRIFRPLENVSIEEGTVVGVHVPADSGLPRRSRSMKDFSFYGIWADREDITDGLSYVDGLRDTLRG